MSILKKLVEFIRSKFGTFVAQNTSVEDQYTTAANRIIDEITKLRTTHVKSVNEEKRLLKLADEKDQAGASKERVVRRLLSEGAPFETLAKLGLLYRRTATALLEKAGEYKEMRAQIEQTVVMLDELRLDLAVTLEYIRET
ncbi:hypothetical protein, partial [Xanthomonas campestris]|uniref:hypothetical protein n=1 Tax=Xanthomonas campestris TaxID=339 RepID=UPI004039BB6D